MVDVRRLPVGEDNEVAVSLDDLAREGARRMIASALEAEVSEYVERFGDERGEDGKRLVVRNGRARERRITIGSGTVAIQAPRINDKRVDEQTGGAPEVRLTDLAGLRQAVAEGQRRAAGALPARAVDRRLSAGAGSSCSARARAMR